MGKPKNQVWLVVSHRGLDELCEFLFGWRQGYDGLIVLRGLRTEHTKFNICHVACGLGVTMERTVCSTKERMQTNRITEAILNRLSCSLRSSLSCSSSCAGSAVLIELRLVLAMDEGEESRYCCECACVCVCVCSCVCACWLCSEALSSLAFR